MIGVKNKMTVQRKSVLVIALVFCVSLLMVLNSCSLNREVNYESRIQPTEKIKLNERQISICETMGIATRYEDLTLQQQKCIVRIEELLQYLDNKYNATFEYHGYCEAFAPVYQKEKLEAYTDDTGEFEYTTLTVESDGSYKDDYPLQLIKPIVRYDFIEYMKKHLNKEFKVYAIKGETKITDIRSISKEALSGTTVLGCTAFVEQSADLDVTTVGTAIGEWYKSLGVYGNTNVIAVNKGTLKDINFDNYSSVKLNQKLSNYLLCEVDSSGEYELTLPTVKTVGFLLR